MKDLSKEANKNSFLGKKKSSKVKKIELGKGKLKKTKTISEEQDILNILRSSTIDIKDFTSVNKALAIKNKMIDDYAKADFYVDILKYNYNISKISISDILGGKKLNSVLFMGNLRDFPMKCFSNDKLFWVTFVCTKYGEFTKIQTFIDFSNLKMDIATLAIKFENDYKEGYVQDFNRKYTFVGFDKFTGKSEDAAKTLIEGKEDEIKKILKRGDSDPFKYVKKTFKYNNVDYTSIFINNDIALIYDSSYNANQIVDYAKETKIVSSSDLKKAKNELEIKKAASSEGERGGIYISQSVKLTDFAPIIVSLEKSMNTEMLFQFDIDVAAFNEYLLEKHNKLKDDKTNIHQKAGDFFDKIELDDKDIGIVYSMLLILYITNYKNDVLVKDFEFKNNLRDFLQEYPKMKENIIKGRYLFDMCNSLIEKFYDAFKSKINFEPIKAIYNTLIKSIMEIEEFFNSYPFASVNTFLEKYGLNNVFVRLVKCLDNYPWIHDLIKRIHSIGKMFNTLENGKDILKKIRETGVLCYRIFYNPNEADALGLVWKIRTPSSFLGNVFFMLDEKFDLRNIETLDKAMKKYAKSEEDEIASINTTIELMGVPSREDESTAGMIKYGLAYALLDYGKIEPKYIFKNVETRDEFTNAFTKWFTENLGKFSEEEVKLLYLYYIAVKKRKGISAHAVYLSMKFLETLSNSYQLFIKENLDKRDTELLKIKSDIADLKKKEEEIKETDEGDIIYGDEDSTAATKGFHKKEDLGKHIKAINKYILDLEHQKAAGLKIIEDESGFDKAMLKLLRDAGIVDQAILETIITDVSDLAYKGVTKTMIANAYKRHNELIKAIMENEESLAKSGLIKPKDGLKFISISSK